MDWALCSCPSRPPLPPSPCRRSPAPTPHPICTPLCCRVDALRAMCGAAELFRDSCAAHGSKLTSFCTDCAEAVCASCAVLHHAEHVVVKVSSWGLYGEGDNASSPLLLLTHGNEKSFAVTDALLPPPYPTDLCCSAHAHTTRTESMWWTWRRQRQPMTFT